MVNHKDEIIVTEYKSHCLSVFHPSGKKLRSFGIRGSKDGQFNHPSGVTVDDNDNILVADSKSSRLMEHFLLHVEEFHDPETLRSALSMGNSMWSVGIRMF